MVAKLLILSTITSGICLVLSAYQIRRHKTQLEFITHWAFLLGAFVWEDLFVISLFSFGSLLATLLARDWRVGLLIYLVFWVIRNLGEMIYWFLQQFNQPTVYPHNQYHGFFIIRKILGEVSNQQCFILMQVLHEALMAVMLSLLLLLMLNWGNLSGAF